MTTNPSTPTTLAVAAERADIVEALRKHRGLFRLTVAGLSDEQARLTPTVSALSLGGLVKHLSAVERQWASFVTDGPAPTPDVDWANIDWANPPPEVQEYADGFRMLDGESLAGLLAAYDGVAARTERWSRRSTSTPGSRCPRLRGSSPVRRGASGGSSPTWSPRPPSTPATPTSSARPSTVSGRWAERRPS